MSQAERCAGGGVEACISCANAVLVQYSTVQYGRYSISRWKNGTELPLQNIPSPTSIPRHAVGGYAMGDTLAREFGYVVVGMAGWDGMGWDIDRVATDPDRRAASASVSTLSSQCLCGLGMRRQSHQAHSNQISNIKKS